MKKIYNNIIFKVLCMFLIFLFGCVSTYFIINKRETKGVFKNIVTTTLEESSDLKTAINSVYESTVYIEVSNDTSMSSGSGFIYKQEKDYSYILTNYHVIENGNSFSITLTDGNALSATLLGGDEYYDIAVLKISNENVTKIAEIGDSSLLELGDTVFTVGAPLGKEYMGTITKGIVSGINRMVSVKLTSGSYLMEVIQTDASINSGNSGGPICNIKGQVIGITSSKLIGDGVEGMGFAIPINYVMDITSSIERGDKIVRPYLGVQLVDIDNTFALQYYNNISIGKDVTFGAVLSYVEDSKPASKAGLKVGDVIVSIENEKVTDVSYFRYLLYKHNVGDKINIKYYRGNQLLETTIELTESINNDN